MADNGMSFEHAGRSLIIAVIAALIGLAFAWGAGSGSVVFSGVPAVFLCALVAFAVNWLAFIPAALFQSDRFYDTTGALTYLTVIAVACAAAIEANGALDPRRVVVAGMVALWTIRLGSFLFTRIHAAGGTDVRFEKIKVNPPRFLVAWTLQACWVIFTASAALVIITAPERAPLDAFFWAGAALWVVGFAFEVVADDQKRRFKADPVNKGRFITSGLWAWSQHPNYFGEITLWTGILVIALPLLSGWNWLVVFSPVFVTLLLTKVSGINLLDAIARKRWGDDPAYQAYRARTPVLFPRPPRG
jgi:steroid 5-alpha reductase family enzyme